MFRLLLRLLILCVVGLPLSLAAQDARSHETPSTVLLDPSFSPRAGVATFEAAAQGLYALEDRYLPIQIGGGTGVGGFLGVLYRFARLNLLDNPIAVAHTVLRHEVAGHGGRVRQLGGEVLEYDFRLPPPYGDGGGSIRFQFDDPEAYELAASVAGGLESAHLEQMALEERWLTRGRMDYREALQYLTVSSEIVGYILSAGGGQPTSGHDVENYIALVNQSFPGKFKPTRYGWSGNGDPVVVSDLNDAAAVELLNPSIFYSMYAVFWRFLVRGQSDAGLPAIDIGTLRTLPTLHLRLTPFGHEYAGGVAAAWSQSILGARFRVGDGPWGAFRGVELSGRRLYSVERVELGGDVGLWRQYDLEARSVEPRWGGLASVTGTYQGPGWPVSAVAELGYKTQGYTPGEHLDAGVILRVGVSAEF